MPPCSVLCAPGAAFLSTTGKPSSFAASTAASALAATRSGTSGTPYARAGGASARRRASRRLPRGPRARRPEPRRGRTRDRAPCPPAGGATRRARPPRERLRGRLGIGEGRHRARSGGDGRPLRAEERAQDGLAFGRRGRSADRRADRLLVGADGRDEEDDRGVERRIGEQRGQRRLEALRVRAAEQVDRVRGAALGRHEVGERGARLLARLRQFEAERLAGVGREDAQPAGVRDDRDAPAARHRLGREQRRDVDQLVERARRITPASANSASAAASEPASAAVWIPPRGCPRASCRPSARGSACAARACARYGERSRVAERLEVEHDELGRVVVLPPLEQVVRRDVRLVADRDEGGDAEAAASARSSTRARVPRSGRRRRSCRRGSCAGERRVEVDRCGGDAEAVRPEQAGAARADEREEGSCRSWPRGPSRRSPPR